MEIVYCMEIVENKKTKQKSQSNIDIKLIITFNYEF